MTETTDRLAERLSQEGQRTLEFFKGFPSDSLHLAIYSDGSCWNAFQILAHFVSSEKAFSLLIEDILGGGSGTPRDFDIDAFNEADVNKISSIGLDELLREFSKSREVNIRLVRNMSAADLARTGRHPFLGLTSMDEIIKLLYRHNQIHLRDVRKFLNALNEEMKE